VYKLSVDLVIISRTCIRLARVLSWIETLVISQIADHLFVKDFGQFAGFNQSNVVYFSLAYPLNMAVLVSPKNPNPKDTNT